jgi:beta-N-acetylhexosaminidase
MFSYLTRIRSYIAFFVLLFVSLPICTAPAFSQAAPAAPAGSGRFEISEKAWKWADKEIRKMTLDEKIGQTLFLGVNAHYYNQEREQFKEMERQVVQNKIGGITLFAGPVYESVHVMNRMQALAKYPLLISADFETGVGMRFEDTTNFPWTMAVGATGDPELARRQGTIIARESRAMGVYHIFAPVADINNNPDNPVINVRSYGEDPHEVERFVTAFAQGLQAGGVLATAKHFPGHGDTAVDSHRGLPSIDHSREQLENNELIPFRALINAGIGSIMVAHIALPKIDPTQVKPLDKPDPQTDVEQGAELVTDATSVPSTLSSTVIQQILRRDMGFKGLVVTDALSMSGLTLYVHNDEGPARSFIAGADMLLKPVSIDLAIKGMKAAVASGQITEARLNESVRKILAVKYQLGLVQNRISPLENIDKVVSSNETLQLADEIARKAVTLVRNDENLVPIKDAAAKKVFLLALSNGEDRNFVAQSFSSVLRQGGVSLEVLTLDSRSTAEEARTALAKAAKADIVIAGLYGRVRSGSKNSTGLPEPGVQILKQLLQTTKPVIGVSFGNPYFLNAFPDMRTYIAAYGDMTMLQRASANAILGKQDIVGRLPISLPGLAPRGTGIQLKKLN